MRYGTGGENHDCSKAESSGLVIKKRILESISKGSSKNTEKYSLNT